MPKLDTFVLKRGDTHEPIVVQFTMEDPNLPEDQWPPMDCTSADELKFFMRPAGQVGGPGAPAAKIAADGVWLDKPNGIAKYVFTSADVNTAGNWWAEMQAHFPDNSVATAPNGANYILVVIGADLG